jgi:hypothetical protein
MRHQRATTREPLRKKCLRRSSLVIRGWRRERNWVRTFSVSRGIPRMVVVLARRHLVHASHEGLQEGKRQQVSGVFRTIQPLWSAVLLESAQMLCWVGAVGDDNQRLLESQVGRPLAALAVAYFHSNMLFDGWPKCVDPRNTRPQRARRSMTFCIAPSKVTAAKQEECSGGQVGKPRRLQPINFGIMKLFQTWKTDLSLCRMRILNFSLSLRD